MASIKETREALVGVNELSLFLATRLSNGLHMDDLDAVIEKLVFDPEFRAVVKTAVEGCGNIPDEMKTMGQENVHELVAVQLSYIPKLIEALGGDLGELVIKAVVEKPKAS